MAIPGFNWTFFNVAADDVPRVLTPAQEAARKLQQEQDDYAVALRIQNGFDEGDLALAERLYEEQVQDLIEASKTPIGADEVEPGDANAAHYVEPPRLCVACSDDPGVATLPCGHPYCADCLTGVLRNSMTDGTAFPPRCCRQDIEIEEVRRHLEPAFAVEFDAKAIELSTVNPVYCSNAACSVFIPPAVVRGGDVALCPSCFTRTCTHCKAGSHPGDCQEDQGLQQLLQMAEGEGWRRCECGRVIELNFGCNHMTVSAKWTRLDIPY
ncbi:unnamed protein product [Zymoseptoria tritici ST99CH_3D1]|nr:unnamed protein product [Zymoseptoria tritici ST99CH_3D1]